jgi:hypothetical protein
LKRLRNGEKFADVAKDVSIEPAAATTGGALANQEEDNPCFTLTGLSQVNFDPLFVAAALSARAGIPTGPAKSSFGYHIILNAPWNEVSDAVTALVSASPGPVLSQGSLISTKNIGCLVNWALEYSYRTGRVTPQITIVGLGPGHPERVTTETLAAIKKY